MNRGTLCLLLLDNLYFGKCANSVGKDANVAFGGENEYVWVWRELLSQCVIFWPFDVLCICSSPKSVSRGWQIYTRFVPRAALSGQPSHGLHVYWVWIRVEKMVHYCSKSCCLGYSADMLAFTAAKWLCNKSKKRSGLQVFHPPKKYIS